MNWEFLEDLFQNSAGTCKVQHDLCHRFTADVHVLHCITVLDELFQGKRPEADQYLKASEKRDPRSTLSNFVFT